MKVKIFWVLLQPDIASLFSLWFLFLCFRFYCNFFPVSFSPWLESHFYHRKWFLLARTTTLLFHTSPVGVFHANIFHIFSPESLNAFITYIAAIGCSAVVTFQNANHYSPTLGYCVSLFVLFEKVPECTYFTAGIKWPWIQRYFCWYLAVYCVTASTPVRQLLQSLRITVILDQ